MIKVYIEQVLYFDENFVLEVINQDREWDDLELYESIEEIPEEEILTWLDNSTQFLREEMEVSDYNITKITTNEEE